jgi:hypothetical protein
MVLWCVGFGDERRSARPSYDGFAFWETDPFERPDWGVSPLPNDLRGLVSGGGDADRLCRNIDAPVVLGFENGAIQQQNTRRLLYLNLGEGIATQSPAPHLAHVPLDTRCRHRPLPRGRGWGRGQVQTGHPNTATTATPTAKARAMLPSMPTRPIRAS